VPSVVWSATIGLGQTGTPTVRCAGTPGIAFIQQLVVSGASYEVPAGNWTITEWRVDAGSLGGGELALKVFRETTPGSYEVVGESSVQILSNGLNTFAANIAARGGDRVGLWAANATVCSFPDTGTANMHIAKNAANPALGIVLDSWSGPFTDEFRMNLSATLVSSDGIATPPPPSPRGGYCATTPVMRADGTSGIFVDLELGQADTDPTYAGATPAFYYEGVGLTCDPPPPGYVKTSTKVNGSGHSIPGDPGAIYDYWVKPPA
jgi:hypothetical protein